jgi:hypothetical protein
MILSLILAISVVALIAAYAATMWVDAVETSQEAK